MAREDQHLWNVPQWYLPSDPLIVMLAMDYAGAAKRAETTDEWAAIMAKAPWRAIYTIVAVAGHPEIGEVQLVPADPANPAPLSARLARDLLKPGDALQKARRALSEMIGDRDDRAQRLRVLHGVDPAKLGVERRGKRQPDAFYAKIAESYVEQVRLGRPNPVAETARLLFDENDVNFVRDALTRARKRELLEYPPRPGKPGGELTALGREALEAT